MNTHSYTVNKTGTVHICSNSTTDVYYNFPLQISTHSIYNEQNWHSSYLFICQEELPTRSPIPFTIVFHTNSVINDQLLFKHFFGIFSVYDTSNMFINLLGELFAIAPLYASNYFSYPERNTRCEQQEQQKRIN